MTIDLYTTADVKRVREQLLKEQKGLDALTGLVIPDGQAVCDHNHTTQYVRAVLHRQSNAVLGKIENLWKRYLSYWYTGTLSEFLRKAADYIERKDDTRFVHPGWIKRVTADFNSCTEPQKKQVLALLNMPDGSNSTKRKYYFNVAIKSKLGYKAISSTIERVKNGRV